MRLGQGLKAAFKEYASAALILMGFLVAWQLVCDWTEVPAWLLPSPTQIFVETWKLRAVLPEHILATLWAVLGGFFLALGAAVPLAIAVVYSPLLRRITYPPLLMLQSVPKVAIAPLLLIWIGYGVSARMIVAATVAFFPIVINTATGLEAADAELLDLTRSFDASRLKVFWKVRLPWALPYLFSSMKVAITLAVIGAVVAEFVGADKGLGYLILTSAGSMQTALMFGALVLLSLLGIICFYAVVWVEKLLCPWYVSVRDPADGS